jgi:hypothetical protein
MNSTDRLVSFAEYILQVISVKPVSQCQCGDEQDNIKPNRKSGIKRSLSLKFWSPYPTLPPPA